MSSQLRGIFRRDEDPQYWIEATEQYPNKIPRFSSKIEAEEFVKTFCTRRSNPDEPHLHHSVSTLTDWNQIEKYLLPKIIEYREKFRDDASHMMEMDDNAHPNRFQHPINDTSMSESESNPVYDHLLSRLDLSIHKKMSTLSTTNTLKYLYYHMRCGIYVMIRNNELMIFCPFVNKQYTNTWSQDLELDCPDNQVETYASIKQQYYRPENYIKKEEWWANGNIICNEHTKHQNKHEISQWWGDHFLFQLKDMIAETCNHRRVPNCEFFVNKRDYPQIKFNQRLDRVVEPYGFIYNKDDRDEMQDIPLSRQLYRSYAPIMSFYSSSRFADIPIPPTEDWEAATGDVFAPGFDHNYNNKQLSVTPARDLFTKVNLKKFERPWSDKIATAFFRGTATGGGVTIDTNQRLHVASLSHDWTSIYKDPPYLDAKITGWNLRDKKIASSKMTFLRSSNFPFSGDRETNFVPIYEQSRYKYVLYIEGHCAACRYGFMMQLGSVILKVDSTCVADQMWYFPLLKPYEDHIPIKADLSDLSEKIEWCRAHNDECQRIVGNARRLYDEYISRDGILDYMQTIFTEIANRTLPEPRWSQPCPLPRAFPEFSVLDADGRPRCCVKDSNALCNTCQRLKDEEVMLAKRQQPPAQEAEEKLEKKRRLAARKKDEIERLRKVRQAVQDAS